MGIEERRLCFLWLCGMDLDGVLEFDYGDGFLLPYGEVYQRIVRDTQDDVEHMIDKVFFCCRGETPRVWEQVQARFERNLAKVDDMLRSRRLGSIYVSWQLGLASVSCIFLSPRIPINLGPVYHYSRF